MMKNLLKGAGKSILLCGFVMLAYSCTPEDGVNGVDGAIGATGAAGLNGTNGTNGTNGVGFDELTKYGSISTTVAGTRIDNVAFSQNNVFKFTAVGEAGGSNSVYVNGNDLNFRLRRFISTPDDVYQDSYNEIYLDVTDAGLATQSIDFENRLNELNILSNDMKFFTLDGYWYDGSTGVTNMSITNYSYNTTTKNLIFSYSYNVSAANGSNNTNHDFTVNGSVDVIVFESLDLP